MESILYFKDMRECDYNNYPKKIYKVEYSRMLIEILDIDHVNGKPQYFSSLYSRDNYLNGIKDYILRINDDELKKIKEYWKKNQVNV